MFSFFRQLLICSALAISVATCYGTASADDPFYVAKQLYQSGSWQQAALAFDRLANDPLQSKQLRLESQVYAAEALVQLGQYSQARDRYVLIQQRNPPARLAAQTLFRLGEAAWMIGQKDEAKRLLQSYVEQYPISSSTVYAQKYLEQIRVSQLAHADFSVLDQAVGWERDGRYDAALAAYHKLLAKHSLVGQVRAETLRRAAKLHDRLKQSREALELYQQFLAEYPTSDRTPAVMLSVAWLHDRLDQTTQAADQFQAVHAKFPQSAQAVEAAYWLAQNSADELKQDRAASYVDWLLSREEVLTKNAKLWSMTLCLQCQLDAEQDRWQEIDHRVAVVRERLAESTAKTKLEFWAAEAAFRLRQYDVARQRFSKLQPKTIGINQPWTPMVPLRRAQLAARRQLWSKVLKILDELEEEHPEFELKYEVDYLRGRALAGRGEMTAARRFYRRVLDNNQAANTEAAAMAGWMTGETYFHQRDYARARAAYVAVMEKTTFSEWRSRAALQAGKCWEREQHWDKAANVYSTALQQWPDSDSDQELESRLRWAQKQQTQSQAVQQR